MNLLQQLRRDLQWFQFPVTAAAQHPALPAEKALHVFDVLLHVLKALDGEGSGHIAVVHDVGGETGELLVELMGGAFCDASASMN